jgi:hypothetical protein
MLIDDAIEAAVREGRLTPVRPVAPWAGEPRVILLCQCVRSEIEKGRADEDDRIRRVWATLEAALSYFVEGGLVTDDFIKQLLPPKYEHWEIRSRKPRPGLRLFGRFAKPDVWVATHVKHRDQLKGMWSPEFEHEKLVCEDHWRNAGLPISPPPGAFTDAPDFRYEAYITENARRRLRVPT